MIMRSLYTVPTWIILARLLKTREERESAASAVSVFLPLSYSGLTVDGGGAAKLVEPTRIERATS